MHHFQARFNILDIARQYFTRLRSVSISGMVMSYHIYDCVISWSISIVDRDTNGSVSMVNGVLKIGNGKAINFVTDGVPY